jgi:4-hydroxy-3-methylbut-2-enyl diphosphate reductase
MAHNVEQIQAGTVIIRSHGAVPEQVVRLKEKGLKIVDATCVLVKRVQRIAKELEKAGYRVVIIGDENHPEIQAVMGCARDVVVVADEADLHKLPKNSKLGIICQTTQSPEHVSSMLGAIAKAGFQELKVINTLCKEAIKRQRSAVKLCKQVDIMFVLGDLESANTRRLAELCKKYNKQTFHLQNWNELDKNILSGKNIAGVTAGASTPEWIIAEFVENLAAFDASAV